VLPQFVANAIMTAAPFALVGVGFALVYLVARFLHFAHAAVFTSCPYFTFLIFSAGWPLTVAIPTAIMLSTGVGCAIELFIYRHLRRKQSPAMVMMLASLGIYVVLQNWISLMFGDNTKTLLAEPVREGLLVLGARVTPVQITTISVSVTLIAAVALMLKYAKAGKAIRAVAADAELARVAGIDSDHVILWAFAIGSALAGMAGILVAVDVDMTPTMGMNVLMMAVVAVIVGGVRSIPGIVLGALLIGFAQNFGTWWLSSQWQDAIVFAILLVFLLFRPHGFLGRMVRKAQV
jgi:branched-chain amino acid transport system permease protein